MSFLAKLTSGLSKSSAKLGEGVAGIFTKRKLDDAALEQLEELLIEADMGAKLAAELCAKLAQEKFDKDVSAQEVREFLAEEVTKILEPVALPLIPLPLAGGDRGGKLTIASPLNPPASGGTIIILVVGVNGNGKTTTIGKLAQQFKGQGLSVMLAAADTFRAAAVEQLEAWGKRADVPVIVGEHESDPASVAFRAYETARAQKIDVLMIDTAGRLQNKANLMQELQKISKVLKKIDEAAPHHVIQVLDATTGQNAISQVRAFKEAVNVTGLVITKLDGTAKGGIVVALARQFGLPIHAVGVGEGVSDLNRFEAIDFARNIVGLSEKPA